MITKTIFAATFAFFSFVGSAIAAPLTIDQIEQAWGGVQPANVPFVQTNADGTQSEGVVDIISAGQLTLTYEPQFAVLRIAGQRFHQQEYRCKAGDCRKWGEEQSYPLGPLSFLFRRATNLRSGVATEIGQVQNSDLTYVKLEDPKREIGGHAYVVFEPSGRLIFWETVNEMGEATRFRLLW